MSDNEKKYIKRDIFKITIYTTDWTSMKMVPMSAFVKMGHFVWSKTDVFNQILTLSSKVSDINHIEIIFNTNETD